MTTSAEIERYEENGADDAPAYPPERLDALLERVDRGITRLRPKPPLAFRFSWRGLRFEAHGQARGSHMVLELGAELATVPFSAEDPLARARLYQLMARFGDGKDCPLTLTRHSAIRYQGTVAIDLPLTATAVMADTVALLLRARPYVELVEELRPAAR